MDTWNHLPPFVQSLVLGNLIEWGFVALLRLIRGRFEPVGPLLDRIGPKSIRDRSARRTSAGCTVALAWFALSWLVGHEALRARVWIVNHLTAHR
jgi:hypothetical protein